MALSRLLDVFNSILNSRTATPIADLVSSLQSIVWNFAAGINVAGNLHVTGGAAITGGETVDSITINGGTLLNQYVEGTFTPVVSGNTTAGVGTYTAQVGTYQRIGNRVHFQLRVTWTAHTGTGVLLVSLPFTANAAANNYAPLAVYFDGTDAAGQFIAYVPAGGSQAVITGHVSGTGLVSVNVRAAGDLMISGNYRI